METKLRRKKWHDEDQEKKIEDWRGKEDVEVVKHKETDDSKVQVDPVLTIHERWIREDWKHLQRHKYHQLAEGCLQTLQNNDSYLSSACTMQNT